MEDIAFTNSDSDADEHDEFDEANQDILTDESDYDESQEKYDSDGEELLFNDTSEEIEDNWTTDVVYSDLNIVYEQEILINVLKKCRALVSMVLWHIPRYATRVLSIYIYIFIYSFSFILSFC
jgi:hypothetical protein